MTTVDISIILPALFAGALVLLTHVPLGMRVLARGIVFIDLAVAQLAGLGAIAASVLGGGHAWVVQLGAVLAALAGGLLLTYTEKRWPRQQEALIGVLFVLAASISMLLLAHEPHADERFREILAGQILWLTYADLGVLALASAILLLLGWGLRKHLDGGAFYFLFALTVTASVQYVGIFLVFSSLIIPALVGYSSGRSKVATAYLVGLSGYIVGLVISLYTDLPAAPLIVCAMSAIALVTAGIRPRSKSFLRE